ncbi:hypothetical protein [Paenisporosarcina sp. TG-14]|uniref:hypothetical protein n=1 Tax=Paenisporosarcina sp. TG-14 TaxID=1231057 RepID=UPI00030BF1AB|nr:hypothetical protein [Paenisporosarcina sp. TG-14]
MDHLPLDNKNILDFYLQYGILEEQITFSVIDYLRGQYKKKDCKAPMKELVDQLFMSAFSIDYLREVIEKHLIISYNHSCI